MKYLWVFFVAVGVLIFAVRIWREVRWARRRRHSTPEARKYSASKELIENLNRQPLPRTASSEEFRQRLQAILKVNKIEMPLTEIAKRNFEATAQFIAYAMQAAGGDETEQADYAAPILIGFVRTQGLTIFNEQLTDIVAALNKYIKIPNAIPQLAATPAK